MTDLNTVCPWVRFRGEADMDRPAKPDGSVENDPNQTCARSVWRLTIWMPEEQAALPGLHFRHSGAAADPGPLIPRTLLEIRAIKSSILERNIFRIGDVFDL